MIKTLIPHGNSATLIIDKPILGLLGITLSTPLKIITDGKSLIISTIEDRDREEQFQTALNKINLNHGETFRKLGE